MRRGPLATVMLGLVAVASCGPGSATGPRTSSKNRTWPGVTTTSRLAEDRVVLRQTIYVPITSSIASADNARPINLASTLVVRNLDPGRPIVVDSIQYHDSGGKLIHEFLDQPIQIGPLASADIFVSESDTTGGSFPSFLVCIAADTDVVPPLAEAVMISTAGAQGLTFTSEGRVIASHHR